MTTGSYIGLHRNDPTYHDQRLRVALTLAEVKGHTLLRMGKFILVEKRLSPDGKIIMRFENGIVTPDNIWSGVARDGVIKIPLDPKIALDYMEGIGYALYLYQW